MKNPLNHVEDNPVEDDNHTPIILEEVKRAFTWIKNGKSHGDDGIPI